MKASDLTNAQRRTLLRAYQRPRKTIFPIVGLWAAASDAVHQSLVKRGLATDEAAPKLTPEGERIAAGELD